MKGTLLVLTLLVTQDLGIEMGERFSVTEWRKRFGGGGIISCAHSRGWFVGGGGA